MSKEDKEQEQRLSAADLVSGDSASDENAGEGSKNSSPKKGASKKTESFVSGGLREKKKEQTRQALEKAILCLVIEKGYEDVTVEEVCKKVGISRKTFFNYFSSKRAAVLGRSYIPLENYPDSDYIDVITGCIEHGLTAEDASPEIKDLRKAAMLSSPEIFFRSNKSSLVLQPAIMEALHAYFTAHPEKRKAPELSLDEECLIGTSAIICVMRSHIMLSSFKDHPARISEAREVVKRYLS